MFNYLFGKTGSLFFWKIELNVLIKISKKKFLTLPAALLLFYACASTATVDLAKYENNICEVHQVEMTIETLKIHPGYLGYLPEYQKIMMSEFPHYKGERWMHSSEMTGSGYVKAHVCVKCTRAFKAYHELKSEN